MRNALKKSTFHCSVYVLVRAGLTFRNTPHHPFRHPSWWYIVESATVDGKLTTAWLCDHR